MKVKLTAPHIIDDQYFDTGAVMDVKAVTLSMAPLDRESEIAIEVERRRLWYPPQRVYDQPVMVPGFGPDPGAQGIKTLPTENTDPVTPVREPSPIEIIIPPAVPRLPPIGKVTLLVRHVIFDQVFEKGATVELTSIHQVSPLMESETPELAHAIEQRRISVWGRFNVPYGFPTTGKPLDDPPISRPLEENQPVWHASFKNPRDYTS